MALDPVADVADAAALPYRGRRLAVRVTPEVEHWQRLAAVLTGTDAPALDELLAALPDEAGDATVEDGKDGTRRNVREQLAALRRAKGKVDFRFPYGPPDAGAIVVAWYGIEGEPAQDQPVTEDDTLSHSAGRQVALDEHTCRGRDLGRALHGDAQAGRARRRGPAPGRAPARRRQGG